LLALHRGVPDAHITHSAGRAILIVTVGAPLLQGIEFYLSKKRNVQDGDS